jgi:tetratricopeptide (TPR) repeat protein
MGEDHPRTLATQSNLIAVKQHRGGNDEEVLQLMLDSLEKARRVHGNEHLNTLLASFNLAVIYLNLEQYEKAERFASSTIAIAKRALSPDHDVTLNSMNVAGAALLGQNRYREAVDLYREIVAARSRLEGPEGLRTLLAQAELAWAYSASGDHDRGMKLLDETIETIRRVFGEDHGATINTLYNAACAEARTGNRDRALSWLRQAVDAGYGNIDWVLQDSDLESLRGDAEFEGLVERIRQNASD